MAETLHEFPNGRLVDINGRLFFRGGGDDGVIESFDDLLTLNSAYSLGLDDDELEELDERYFDDDDD